MHFDTIHSVFTLIVVSLAAVFLDVTQRALRDIQKTDARETTLIEAIF